MKKTIKLILSLALALALVACGNKDNNGGNSEPKQTQGEVSQNEKPENPDTGSQGSVDVKSDEVSYEALMQIPQSPGEDFEIQQNQDGDNTATITSYKGSDTMVYIPDEIDGLQITRLDQYIFNNNDKTPKAVRLSDNVKTLEIGVFGNNEVIEIFVSGSGLEEIGSSVFINADNLRDVRLNEGLKFIGETAFASTESLKEIIVPSTVERVELAAFHFMGGTSPDDETKGDGLVKGKAGSAVEAEVKESNVKFEAVE